MAAPDSNETRPKDATNGNAAQKSAAPRFRFSALRPPGPPDDLAPPPADHLMAAQRDISDLMASSPREGRDGPGAQPAADAGARSPGWDPEPDPLPGRDPQAPPHPHAELMPRREPSGPRGATQRPRAAQDKRASPKVARPQAARGVAREERKAAPPRRGEEGGARRHLPARRVAERGGTYVMGTANPCRACGMAVWVAGKDARGRWIKVNLDGSAHICGAPMTGLGWAPPPFVAAQQPVLMPGSAGPPFAPATSAAPAHAVADQGRLWVERFMVVVASVALLFLATIPRQGSNGGPPAPGGTSGGSAAQKIAAAPGAAAPAGAPSPRPDPPRKESFSLGSTEDDVMAVMGPPREIYDNRWWYGSSYVDFRNGRVVNFYNSIHGELKVKMQGTARSRPVYLSKGLNKDEVLSLQGTPTRLAGNRWYYGSSYIDFREDRVEDYFNGVLRELKVRTGPTTP